MKVKAIIFDMGGVLVDLDINDAVQAFRELGFDNVQEFLDMFHQKGLFNDMEDGSISEEEFYRICLDHCRPGTSAEDIRGCYRRFLPRVNPKNLAYIASLAGKYPLYVLSNNNPIAISICSEYFNENGLPYPDSFREQFLSYQLKMLKPLAPIYDHAIGRIGCDPSEILFIDDSLKNVEGARARGINAVLFPQGADMESFLKDYLN